jgi:hypothetical protein
MWLLTIDPRPTLLASGNQAIWPKAIGKRA